MDLNFSLHLPDGSRVALTAGGEDVLVGSKNWREYVDMAERCRLRESVVLFKVCNYTK
jgi:hypothetical protein